MQSTTALAVSTCCLLFAPAPGDQPTFHVAADTAVSKTFTEKLELELESLRLWHGGEELPAEDLGALAITTTAEQEIVVTDRYLAMDAGRPAKLERTFETLAGHSSESVDNDGETSKEERERESELEGSTVVFAWNEEEQRFDADFEDQNGEADLLEGLVEDLDLRAFLPGKSVAAGDTWEVEAQAFNALAFPGGDLALESTDDEAGSIDRRQRRDNVGGKIGATYKGRREEGGVQVDVIALTFEITTSAADESEEHGGTRARKFAFTYELEGELLWAGELGRAHALAVSGAMKLELDQSASFQTDEGEFSFRQQFAFAGTVEYGAQFETHE